MVADSNKSNEELNNRIRYAAAAVCWKLNVGRNVPYRHGSNEYLCAEDFVAAILTEYLQPWHQIEVMAFVDGGVVQGARASVPCSFSVVDADVGDEEKEAAMHAAGQIYEKLPYGVY